MAANQMQIEYPVVFSGEDKTKGTNENKIYGARDFLDEALRVRIAQGYNDAQTMQWIIKALKESALKWFNKQYLRHVGMDDKTKTQDELKTDFALFEKTFRSRYNIPVIRKHYLFDSIRAQTTAEKPADYLDRIVDVTLDQSKFLEEEAKKYHAQPPEREVTFAEREMTTLEYNQAQKDLAYALIKRNRKQMAEDTMELHQAHMTKAFFSNGLKDTHLKAAAQKAFDESETGDLTTMYKAVQMLYARMKPSANVHAIEGAEDEEEGSPEEAVVEAVKAKKKPKTKKPNQKSNNKTSTTSATPSEEECSHCGKRGHKALVCYSRIRQLEKIVADSGKQLEKPNRASQIALNANGKWS